MKRPMIGGQAVIEGVMMKSERYLSIAVRNPKGKIVTKKEKSKKKNKFQKLPLIRGIISLFEMLIIGLKALTWSANESVGEEEEKLGKAELAITLTLSLGFVIVFFVGLPYFLTIITGVKEELNPVIFNLIDGIIKIGLFTGYLLLISLMSDVKTLFKYHGAEHKTVHCYEARKPLTVKNVKPFSTLHPRCGTSFVIMVFFISVIVFSFIPLLVIAFNPNFLIYNIWIQKGILFPLRILVIPIIAGFGYEILRLSAKYQNNPIINIFIQPGLWFQRITTKEPTKKQIEVAITALNIVLKAEKIPQRG